MADRASIDRLMAEKDDVDPDIAGVDVDTILNDEDDMVDLDVAVSRTKQLQKPAGANTGDSGNTIISRPSPVKASTGATNMYHPAPSTVGGPLIQRMDSDSDPEDNDDSSNSAYALGRGKQEIAQAPVKNRRGVNSGGTSSSSTTAPIAVPQLSSSPIGGTSNPGSSGAGSGPGLPTRSSRGSSPTPMGSLSGAGKTGSPSGSPRSGAANAIRQSITSGLRTLTGRLRRDNSPGPDAIANAPAPVSAMLPSAVSQTAGIGRATSVGYAGGQLYAATSLAGVSSSSSSASASADKLIEAMGEEADEVVRGVVRSVDEAADRERRLRRAGSCRVIAPLSSLRASGGGVNNNVNVLKVSSLDKVWAELDKNRSLHGAPSAACAHTKYSAIGTARGAIFLFDHYETLLAILGKSPNAPDAVARGAVISLDIASEGDNLIAGHANGHIAVWDLSTKQILKVVNDFSTCPITEVLFLRKGKLQFVCINSEGTAALVTLNRMFFTFSWTYTTHTLMQGKGNPILAASVLNPNAASPHPADAFSLIAIAFEQSTIIISLEPTVKVVCKISANAPSPGSGVDSSALSQSQVPGEGTGMPAQESGSASTSRATAKSSIMPCLAWLPLRRRDMDGDVRAPAAPSQASNTVSAAGNTGANISASVGATASNSSSATATAPTASQPIDLNADAQAGATSSAAAAGANATGSGISMEVAMATNPVFALARGRQVQFFSVSQIESKETKPGTFPLRFEKIAILLLERDAIAMHWLGGQVLLVLTSNLDLSAYDAARGVLLAQVDSVRNASLACHSYFVNSETKETEKSYSSVVRCSDTSLLMAGVVAVMQAHVLGWFDRVTALIDESRWEAGLALALDFYEGKAKGAIGLPRSKRGLRTSLNDRLVDLVLQFVDTELRRIREESQTAEVKGTPGPKANLPAVAANEPTSGVGLSLKKTAPPGTEGLVDTSAEAEGKPVTDDKKLDISAVAAIAIDFCCCIERFDVLFKVIFAKLRKVANCADAFFDHLEPYVLSERIVALDGPFMVAMAERMIPTDSSKEGGGKQQLHPQQAQAKERKGRPAAFEQLIFRTSIAPADAATALLVCRTNSLFGALIYVFISTRGSYRCALEEALRALILAQDAESSPNAAAAAADKRYISASNLSPSQRAAAAWRMLFYTRCTLLGVAFPTSQSLPPHVLPRAHAQVLAALCSRAPVRDPLPFTGKLGEGAGYAAPSDGTGAMSGNLVVADSMPSFGDSAIDAAASQPPLLLSKSPYPFLRFLLKLSCREVFSLLLDVLARPEWQTFATATASSSAGAQVPASLERGASSATVLPLSRTATPTPTASSAAGPGAGGVAFSSTNSGALAGMSPVASVAAGIVEAGAAAGAAGATSTSGAAPTTSIVGPTISGANGGSTMTSAQAQASGSVSATAATAPAPALKSRTSSTSSLWSTFVPGSRDSSSNATAPPAPTATLSTVAGFSSTPTLSTGSGGASGAPAAGGGAGSGGAGGGTAGGGTAGGAPSPNTATGGSGGALAGGAAPAAAAAAAAAVAAVAAASASADAASLVALTPSPQRVLEALMVVFGADSMNSANASFSAGGPASSGSGATSEWTPEQTVQFYEFAARVVAMELVAVTALPPSFLVNLTVFLASAPIGKAENALADREAALVSLVSSAPVSLAREARVVEAAERSGIRGFALELYKRRGDFAKVVDAYIREIREACANAGTPLTFPSASNVATNSTVGGGGTGSSGASSTSSSLSLSLSAGALSSASLPPLAPIAQPRAAALFEYLESAPLSDAATLGSGSKLPAVASSRNPSGRLSEVAGAAAAETALPSAQTVKACREAFLERVADLVLIDAGSAARIILTHFSKEHDRVLDVLNSNSLLLFYYLRCLMAARGSAAQPSSSAAAASAAAANLSSLTITSLSATPESASIAASKSVSKTPIATSNVLGELLERSGVQFTAKLNEQYIRLLCVHAPRQVFAHITAHHDYNIDVVLKLCQSHRIHDACAHLLERTGDVQGALELNLFAFKENFNYLRNYALEKSDELAACMPAQAVAFGLKQPLHSDVGTAAAVDLEVPKAAEYRVFAENDIIWDMHLARLGHTAANQLKYFILQLLVRRASPHQASGFASDNAGDAAEEFFVWTRSHSADQRGQEEMQSFGSNVASAKGKFSELFVEKTGNSWPIRGKFVARPDKQFNWGIAEREVAGDKKNRRGFSTNVAVVSQTTNSNLATAAGAARLAEAALQALSGERLAAVTDVVTAAVQLCQRTMDPERLWFALLDTLVKMQRALGDERSGVTAGSAPTQTDVNDTASAAKKADSAVERARAAIAASLGSAAKPTSSAAITSAGVNEPIGAADAKRLKSSHMVTLKVLESLMFSFVRRTLQSMTGSVSLTAIMTKVITDHSSDNLREFRDTIQGVFDTYSYEISILKTANTLIMNDKFKSMQRRHRAQAHAYVPRLQQPVAPYSSSSASTSGKAPAGTSSGSTSGAQSRLLPLCSSCRRPLSDASQTISNEARGAVTAAGKPAAGAASASQPSHSPASGRSSDAMIFACGHSFHNGCLNRSAATASVTVCPQCATQAKEEGAGAGGVSTSASSARPGGASASASTSRAGSGGPGAAIVAERMAPFSSVTSYARVKGFGTGASVNASAGGSGVAPTHASSSVTSAGSNSSASSVSAVAASGSERMRAPTRVG